MRIAKPIIILGAPRSGTTILFSILSSHPELWSVYAESGFLERYIGPDKLGWHNGNRVGSEVVTGELREKVVSDCYHRAVNYQALFPNASSRIYANRRLERILRKASQLTVFAVSRPEVIRLVEKTPRNMLRIPFLNAIFPDAYFVFLARDPRANISSLLEGWKQPNRFKTYEVPGGLDIRDYPGSKWSFLLPPDWEVFSTGKTLVEVCAFQYRVANQIAFEDLREIPDGRKSFVKYESLVASPEETVQRLCAQLGLAYTGGTKKMAETMPPVNVTSQPEREKWIKNEGELAKVLDSLRDISAQIGYQL
jgi:hypothetical protein